MTRATINAILAIPFAAFVFGGCAIGQVRSQAPVPAQLAQAQNWNTALAGDASSKPADDASLSHWWSVFGDQELIALEERALKANLSLRTAQSNILQARANRYSASGSLYPAVTVNGSSTGARSATRSGVPYTPGGQYSQNYSAAFAASWEPDFFGAQHKNVAAFDTDIQAAQESLRNTMVSLTAELALDYISVRSYQSQVKVTQQNLAEYKDTYETTLEKQESGLATDLDVEQALQIVRSTEATIPTLETSLKQAKNAIAVLLGERPGAIDAELAAIAPIPVIPPDVAVGVPADLLRRRPDVRTAERQLTGQLLRVGVAKANLYPTFSLSATFQFGAANILNLFTPATLVSNVVGAVQHNIVNRRQLKGQLELQNALVDQYEVAYESTVLGAVQDVENALQAFGADQVRRKSLAEATLSASNALDISRELYGAGLKDFLTLLDAERSVLVLQNSLVQSDAAIASDLIQLYKALGGGWQ